jgi:acyl dehydratase
MTDNPSELTFDQINIGYTKEFQVIVTESLINDFAKLSGDYSPIHINEDYAKSKKFKGRVVHGMLLASFLSRMVGMYLPGIHALYASQSLEFHNPCFINDEITVSSVVNDKSESTKIIKIESKITNNKNEILLNGVGRIIVRDD